MNRTSMLLAGALVMVAPLLARADYLYDAFRDCDDLSKIDKSLLYSAAEPVIGTVPWVESEIGRVGSNFLVYTGFRFEGKGALRGRLYGVRLFKEKTVKGNDWEFTDVDSEDVFSNCATDKACVFDAAKMLENRTTARKIFAGYPKTSELSAGGSFTLTEIEPRALPRSSAGAEELKKIWEQYVSLDPIRKALPVYNASSTQDNKWDCSALPNHVSSNKSYCPPGTSTESASTLLYPSDLQRSKVVYWLDGGEVFPGLDIRLRKSRLGDLYHSSATIVEPPGFEYKDRYYPEFRKKLQNRPSMIYVGANDGMIHAFYASPDFEMILKDEKPRWAPGEEAWSYLPASMLARTLVEVDKGSQRFYSQDLSCRFTDVQVDTKYVRAGDCTGSDDEYCGWRTILLCGQGMGGSWYMAFDVTNPLEGKPKPLWEFTHLAEKGEMGMGRAWSLPSMSLVPIKEGTTVVPRWVAVFGSGLNTSMVDKNGGWRRAYRNLNLPFDGDYPENGRGGTPDKDGYVYVMDVATGKILKRLASLGKGAMVADGTVLDLDADGVVDVGYLAGFDGMQRLRLGRDPSQYGLCSLAGFDPQNKDGKLTGHPTAFAYKGAHGRTDFDVVLVAGAGLDSGKDPDQVANSGNNWSISARQYKDDKGATCPSATSYCPLSLYFNDGDRKARLLGAPLFARQANGDDWLLYSIWTAPHFNFICSDKDDKSTGNAHLFCMDVTLDDDPANPGKQKPRCKPCKGYDPNDKDFEKNTLLYSNRIQPPSAPVSADGRVFISDPVSGLKVKGITDSSGHSPNANSNPPKQAVPAKMLSWREVF